MIDTRPHLASLNIEQVDAILEIIRHAPDHANSDTVATVVEETIREARDRAFEIEKLTKAAIEDVRESTGSTPSPALVALIVSSVWENVHRERQPHGEYGDGLLPGMDADGDYDAMSEWAETSMTLPENSTTALHGEDAASAGTALIATVNDDGGSKTQDPPLDPPIDEGPILRSAPYVHTFGDDAAVPAPQTEVTPYHLDLVEDDTISDEDTTINDITDVGLLDGLIAEAADAPPIVISPPFGAKMTANPKPGSPFWTEPTTD